MEDDEISELINLVISPEDKPTEKLSPLFLEVKKFLVTFNIKSGDKVIPNYMVYRKYKKFSKNPVTQNKFTRVLSKFFDCHISSGLYCFKLDPTNLDIPEGYSYYQDLKKKKAKNGKKNKKKQNPPAS